MWCRMIRRPAAALLWTCQWLLLAAKGLGKCQLSLGMDGSSVLLVSSLLCSTLVLAR